MGKTLIISHNPLCENDNMGITLSNIFKKFNANELCQLYIVNQKPDLDKTSNYYRIDEKKLIKSIFIRNSKTGNEITNSEIEDDSYDKKSNKIKKNTMIYLVRNMVWNLSNWFSKDFKNWLLEQQPTAIFVACGDYTFLFKIAIKIAKYLDVPIYTYYVDEYLLEKKKVLSLIDYLVYKFWFKRIVKYANMNFCLTESMRKVYINIFKKEFFLLPNCCDEINEDVKSNINKKNIIISYIGNLDFHRYETLLMIGNCLSILNDEYEKKIYLEIFSQEKDDNIIRQLKNHKSVIFGGGLTQEQCQKKIESTDILLHVESFNSDDLKWTRYSMSTKIPQSLASGKLFICCGPIEAEAINYIFRNKAGIVISDSDKIMMCLRNLYEDKIDISSVIKNEIELVKKNHLIDNNSIKIKKILLKNK